MLEIHGSFCYKKSQLLVALTKSIGSCFSQNTDVLVEDAPYLFRVFALNAILGCRLLREAERNSKNTHETSRQRAQSMHSMSVCHSRRNAPAMAVKVEGSAVQRRHSKQAEARRVFQDQGVLKLWIVQDLLKYYLHQVRQHEVIALLLSQAWGAQQTKNMISMFFQLTQECRRQPRLMRYVASGAHGQFEVSSF